LNGCGKFRLPVASDLSSDMTFFGSIAQIRAGQFTVSDYRTRPTPLAQANIPGGADARVVPAVHVFADLKLDLDAIKTPRDASQKPLEKL
jgi:hypothetical protein